MMRKAFVLWTLCLLVATASFGQGEPFSGPSMINRRPPSAQRYYLGHPFEIAYGRDNQLYVSERVGRILRVDPVTGVRTILLDHRASTYLTITRNGTGVATSIGQDGMMGMALHPNFGLGSGEDFIYIAYTYSAGNLRISRFTYSAMPSPNLNTETVLVQGIPANNDHSSGRLIVGADNLLYYTCGDLGFNQFGNRCNEVRSQKFPTAAQMTASNYSNYSGKTLRIGLDGSIPASNPVFGGVRSHVFTLGHRNAQGLVTQKNSSYGSGYPVPTPGGKLFNSEHGPRTDDEINIIEGGKNYGWPYISGYLDNINYQYINWVTSPNCASTPYNENAIPTGAIVRQETDTTITNFQPPVSTLYTVCTPLLPAVCDAGGTEWMKYPTIAPSSIDFYHVQAYGIPGWYPSLLVPTLRRGTLYRYKLNSTMDGFEADSIPYFKTTNRYRDIAISNDGMRIYLVTDSIGTTSGPSGSGTSALANPGSILEFLYTGATLDLATDPEPIRRSKNLATKIYPNPASSRINIEIGDALHVRPASFQLRDLSGRELRVGKSSDKNFRIDIRGLATGVYVLKIWNGLGLELTTEKIIVR